MYSPAHKHFPLYQGFTLLEVLIAIIVFSIGLLGLASLQITGFKLGHDSQLRSTATVYANDMVDRMRANAALLANGSTSVYNNPTASMAGNPNCLGKNSSGAEENVQCNSSQMASHDFYEWYALLRGQAASAWHPQIRSALPSGDGIVCIDSTPNDGAPLPGNPGCDGVIAIPAKPIFVVKIWWRERKDETNPGTLQRFVTSVSP